MAGVRRRGHDPVLCSAPARSGLRQIEPAEDHRGRHRLAFPRRAQTRAEGVNDESKGGFQIPIRQTRRHFLTYALAMAGTSALADAPQAFALEGALETTAVCFLHS